MNAEQRKKLDIAQKQVEQALATVGDVLDENQSSLDNMPEGLQNSDKGEAMQSAIDTMDEINGFLTDAVDSFNNLE